MASVCDECVFPFIHNNNTYHKCTWDYASHPFCITHSSPEPQQCTNNCPTENKICSECQFPFEYMGKNYSKCTIDNWRSMDYDHSLDVNGVMSWCVTNRSTFSSHSGWHYCSRDCPTYIAKTDNKHLMKVIVITVSIVLAFLSVVIGMIYRWRRKKALDGSNIELLNKRTQSTDPLLANSEVFRNWKLVEARTRNKTKERCNRMHLQSKCRYTEDEPSVVWNGESVVIDSENSIVLYAVPPSTISIEGSQIFQKFEISIEKKIGSGSFGIVYKAYQINGDGMDGKDVAVKTFFKNTNSMGYAMLLNEIELLGNLEQHFNVVRMLLSCTTDLITKENIWLVIEYCRLGDMKQFLIKNKNQFLDGHENCSTNRRLFVKWSYHIAKGMQHLAQHNIMHGDLAARNILISEFVDNGETHLVAKLSDLGMSTRFYGHICYQKFVSRKDQWKWMAIEFLKYGFFTTTSDVWSYGVTIWEILSLGEVPYSDWMFNRIAPIVPSIIDGRRLKCPENVKQAAEYDFSGFFSRISRMCFIDDPIKRNTFSDIVEMLEMELTQEEFDTYNQISSLK